MKIWGATGAPPVADEATGASGSGRCATQPRRRQGAHRAPQQFIHKGQILLPANCDHRTRNGSRWRGIALCAAVSVQRSRAVGKAHTGHRKRRYTLRAKRYGPFYFPRISPQAIFTPALPAGWERKSSGSLWITIVRPRISLTRNRSVMTVRCARPL